ncbi:hypothetical protein F0562_034068 [Nyssa sinensis]|uniref:Uncharacterized protein n=1 Tax=Nyssa sinensis TaxID=561372 RepID=A0A5J5ADT3_9ASTE|nr:hypothetical protein F0562_034068 [Nyssa sinensis]
MVILGKDNQKETKDLVAMGPERSKPLHNFTMPCLKWGNQRFFRCVRVNSNGEVCAVHRRSSAAVVERGLIAQRSESGLEKRGSIDRTECFNKSPSPAAGVWISGSKSKADSDGDDGIEAIREKLMFDLQTAADKMKVAILGEGLEEERPAVAPAPGPAEVEAVRPWNLRTRRAACKAPNGIGGSAGGSGNGVGGKSLKVDERKPNFSPLRTENKSPRLRGVATAVTTTPSGEKKERAKFSVPVSRREVEEDFMAMMGQRPPRRPKKRPKIVQKQLDTLSRACG